METAIRNHTTDTSIVEPLEPKSAANSDSVKAETICLVNLTDGCMRGPEELATVQFALLDEAHVTFEIFDPYDAWITDHAREIIECAYVTPLFVVEAFSRYFCKKILRRVTRGSEKGMTVIDPTASVYTHRFANGETVVVRTHVVTTAKGDFKRRLTISEVSEVVETN